VNQATSRIVNSPDNPSTPIIAHELGCIIVGVYGFIQWREIQVGFPLELYEYDPHAILAKFAASMVRRNDCKGTGACP
jgi:hypothetical protein